MSNCCICNTELGPNTKFIWGMGKLKGGQEICMACHKMIKKIDNRFVSELKAHSLEELNNLISKNEQLKEKQRIGAEYAAYIKCGTYVGGHNEIEDSIKHCLLKIENDDLILASSTFVKCYSKFEGIKGKIPLSEIEDIIIEDASTTEKKVTATRLLALGIFALAAKKKEENKVAFLNIAYKHGRLTYNAIFAFTGDDCFNKANKVKNMIGKKL